MATNIVSVLMIKPFVTRNPAGHSAGHKLATWVSARDANMCRENVFTIKIESLPHVGGRYRWRIFERGKLRGESIESYETACDANAAAHKFALRHIPRVPTE
jgi:hypothetical protein